MKRKAKMPMAGKPTVAPAARPARGASRAPASQPMAPPALAPKVRGMSKMPKMMASGGLTSQGLRSQRASRARDDDLESRYGSQEKGQQESAPQSLSQGRIQSMGDAIRGKKYRRGGKVSGCK